MALAIGLAPVRPIRTRLQQLAGRLPLVWPNRRPLSLAQRYLVASSIVLVVGMFIIGAWVAGAIEQGVLNRSAALTALYVDSVLADHLASLSTKAQIDPVEIATFDHLLADTPLGQRIVVFKVWSPSGEVLYSPDRRLTGQEFAVDGGLERALAGDVSAEVSNLDEPENVYERERWSRLVEVYAPVREQNASGRILAVVEFYQTPDELEEEIAAAQLKAWAVVAAVTAGMYLLLVSIVKRGSDTIARQQAVLARQEAALRGQVSELSALLAQNSRLQVRLRQAAGRTTALNEQALRRLGADLHDGPAQALALALLRLDAPAAVPSEPDPDLEVVRGAVADALDEIRLISTGLRLPALEALTPTEVVERAVDAHKRRSGIEVGLQAEDLPSEAPLPVKIALFRALEETLSNATRHARGRGILVRVDSDTGGISLVVCDRGPGFRLEDVPAEGHLGLVSLRERAELLGGTFSVTSEIGRGTSVYLRLPLDTDLPASV